MKTAISTAKEIRKAFHDYLGNEIYPPPCQSPYNQEKEGKALNAIVNSLMVHVIDAVFQMAEHVQLAEGDEERNAKSNLGLV